MDMGKQPKSKAFLERIFSNKSGTNAVFNFYKELFRVAMILIAALPSYAQSPALGKWWVELRDKSSTPFSLETPQTFLSARALERRANQGILLEEEDLPVNPAYVEAIRQKGLEIHGVSRWMNAVAIIADSVAASKVLDLPFVERLSYLGKHIRIKNPPNRPAKSRSVFPENRSAEIQFGPMGYGLINSTAIQVPFLQAVGARGKDIWIAVMDGGFTNVDTMPFFDSIALQQRLWPGPDFVERDQAVFESAHHGTAVLSVMASNLPGYFVGTAPDATYFLLKTEDTGGEFPIEEVNWILGAEWADSVGVDVINASLGYTTFNDSLLSHRYEELDGKSTIASKGASIAAKKGMIICNSAGNSGNEPWKHLGVPADVPRIVAVGATDTQTGEVAPFSSLGPTADGRIKPDLLAPGMNVVTAGALGEELTLSAGTSIAAPILAGGIASLWSAFPEVPATHLLNAVFASADRYYQPDVKAGYGTPNLAEAWLHLKGIQVRGKDRWYGYQSDQDQLVILTEHSRALESGAVLIKDALGRIRLQSYAWVSGALIKVIEIPGLATLPHGIYNVTLSRGASFYWGK